MSVICCEGGLGNTGYQAEGVAGPTVRIGLMRRIADDGTPNGFSTGITNISSIAINDLINESDPSKRLYLVKNMKDVTTANADPQTQSFNDGQTDNTSRGVKSFDGFIPGQGGVYVSKLVSHGCEEMMAFVIDTCGGISTQIDTNNDLLVGLPIYPGSWNVEIIDATPNLVAGIRVRFEYDVLLTRDALRRYISKGFVEPDMLTLMSLLDVAAIFTSITATGFTVQLNTLYGPVLDPIKVVGWIITDFVLFNNTTPGLITITSVDETIPGVNGIYDFIFPSAPASELRLTDTMDGFELDVTLDTP